MTPTIWSAFCFQDLQIVAIYLGGEFALYAADRFFHVVGDGLGKIPDHARESFPVRGPWPRSLRLCSGERPDAILLGFQTDEVFGIEEAGGVGSIVGPPHLAGALRDLGKGAQQDARLIRQPYSFASVRCWAPACRAPTARPHPGGAEIPSRSRRQRKINAVRQCMPAPRQPSSSGARMAHVTAVR